MHEKPGSRTNSRNAECAWKRKESGRTCWPAPVRLPLPGQCNMLFSSAICELNGFPFTHASIANEDSRGRNIGQTDGRAASCASVDDRGVETNHHRPKKHQLRESRGGCANRRSRETGPPGTSPSTTA